MPPSGNKSPAAAGHAPLTMDSVVWSGITICYSYCWARRRTLGITVRHDKSVSVRVPLRTTLQEIRDFVTQRGAWVVKAWERMDARPARQPRVYRDGALILLLGESWPLEIRTGDQEAVLLLDGRLQVTTRECSSKTAIRRLIDSWYRQQALELVRTRAVRCHLLMQPEGILLPPISIRSMKTRWGSYSYRTGRITLNLNLIKAPLACLDYVIIHELCHIKVRHHGPDFWSMVERYIPDYRDIRKQLTRHLLP